MGVLGLSLRQAHIYTTAIDSTGGEIDLKIKSIDFWQRCRLTNKFGMKK